MISPLHIGMHLQTGVQRNQVIGVYVNLPIQVINHHEMVGEMLVKDSREEERKRRERKKKRHRLLPQKINNKLM
jgi:ribosomal protein S9